MPGFDQDSERIAQTIAQAIAQRVVAPIAGWCRGPEAAPGGGRRC